MILEEFLVYNSIIAILFLLTIKTDKYPTKLLLTVMLFMVLWPTISTMLNDGVEIHGPLLKNSTLIEAPGGGPPGSVNSTIIHNHSVTPLDTGIITWAYIGIFGSLIIHMAGAADDLMKKRKENRRKKR